MVFTYTDDWLVVTKSRVMTIEYTTTTVFPTQKPRLDSQPQEVDSVPGRDVFGGAFLDLKRGRVSLQEREWARF